MTYSNYPALLNRRARIFASLNRAQLVILATIYLAFSAFGVGGMKVLLVNLSILIVMQVVEAKTRKGFFSHLNSASSYKWHRSMGGVNE